MIDIAMFEKKVKEAGGHMTAPEARRADKVVKDLRTGAEAYQMFPLPPIRTAKANSAFDNGYMLTDTIATWIKKSFVAGPFVFRAGFRANPQVFRNYEEVLCRNKNSACRELPTSGESF